MKKIKKFQPSTFFSKKNTRIKQLIEEQGIALGVFSQAKNHLNEINQELADTKRELIAEAHRIYNLIETSDQTIQENNAVIQNIDKFLGFDHA